MTTRTLPNDGEIWLHFKGKQYRIIAIAEDTKTGKTYVVYKALYGTYGDYIRPLSMFMSEVDHEKYPDATQRWRFEKLPNLCSWNPVLGKGKS